MQSESRKAAAARLEAARGARPGELFTAGGATLRRSRLPTRSSRTWAEDPETGKRRDLGLEEDKAFWAWAAVEILRDTGIRIEELTGAVPLVAAYDRYERVWSPPMPLIFQRRIGIEYRPVGIDGVRRLLNFALAVTGLAGASGMPLTFTPHDFRRIFTTVS